MIIKWKKRRERAIKEEKKSFTFKVRGAYFIFFLNLMAAGDVGSEDHIFHIDRPELVADVVAAVEEAFGLLPPLGEEEPPLELLPPAGLEAAAAAAAADALRYSREGPHRRRVPSSEADTRRCGYRGFQWTQFTVREWPVKVANGNSRRMCQTNTLWSVEIRISMTFTDIIFF